MDFICESRWSEGVMPLLYGDVKETFVCGENDHFHLLGWILTEIASGCDISIVRRCDNDFGEEGVNKDTEN